MTKIVAYCHYFFEILKKDIKIHITYSKFKITWVILNFYGKSRLYESKIQKNLIKYYF